MTVPQSAPRDAQCAVHLGRPARFSCARCGNFMCDECSLGGSEAQCPTCRQKLAHELPFSRTDYDFGRVWDYAFEAFKREWLMLSLAALIFFMVSMVGGFISNIIQEIGMRVAGVSQPDFASGDFSFDRLIPFFAVAFVGQLVGMAINVVVQGIFLMGFMRLGFDVLVGRKANLERLFSQLKRLPDYIVQQVTLMLVFGLPVLVSMLLLFGAGFFLVTGGSMESVKHLRPDDFFSAKVLLVAVVTLVWIVVLAALALPLMFAPMELVFGGSGGFESIKRAWALGSGHRLMSFLAALAGTLVIIIGFFACCVGVVPAFALYYLLVMTLYLALRKGSDLPPPIES